MAISSTDAARALAAARRRQTYICAVCGTRFDAYRRTGSRTPVTCSQRCRRRRLRQRRHDELTAATS
ncbi:MAG: hypothetical protein IT201_14545 [Thermoleophilia bacterium]|nr:hypothetical protein [Thermoleophilia bacterium]